MNKVEAVSKHFQNRESKTEANDKTELQDAPDVGVHRRALNTCVLCKDSFQTACLLWKG